VSPPVISIVAKSGTGKTTLLEKLITELKLRGYRVGAMKHDTHQFDIDREGKDSWRLTKAGAHTMVISSPAKIAMIKENTNMTEPSVSDIVNTYYSDVDIVLTEGFKNNRFPKIEVHRKERSSTIMCRGEEHDPTLIAVASNDHLEADVPVFDINDFQGICNLIEMRYLTGFHGETPTV
jgi:molybdopterin-guanine dinucleotide biosynthesis protein MobB